MKKFIIFAFLALFAMTCMFACSDSNRTAEYNGSKVPVTTMSGPELSKVETAKDLGEDFDLQGALALLEGCKDAQAFEKKLNTTKGISNLDLNGDDIIDFITVKEFQDGNKRGYALATDNGSPIANLFLTVEKTETGDANISSSIEGDPYMYSGVQRYDGPQTVVNNYGSPNQSHSGGGNDFLETMVMLSLIDNMYSSRYDYDSRPSYYSRRSYSPNYNRYSTTNVTVNKTIVKNTTARSRTTTSKSPNTVARTSGKLKPRSQVYSGKTANTTYKKKVDQKRKQASYKARSNTKTVKSGGFGSKSKSSSGSSYKSKTTKPTKTRSRSRSRSSGRRRR